VVDTEVLAQIAKVLLVLELPKVTIDGLVVMPGFVVFPVLLVM
jgi:hypothetical protein